MAPLDIALDPDDPATLRHQLARRIITAITGGAIAPGARMPSTRLLAGQLAVARNTVIAAYADLSALGYLVAAPRNGHAVAASAPGDAEPAADPPACSPVAPRWERRMTARVTRLPHRAAHHPWQDYPFPFVCGQPDPSLFPHAEWRDCARRALGPGPVGVWTADGGAADDPALVEQLRRVVLAGRGIHAAEDEVLITLGVRQALFLLAFLLFREDTVVGLEDPGDADARAMFALRSRALRALPVDEHGLVADAGLAGCDYVYVTPAHQLPTTVAMTQARRVALLERAEADGFFVIEDDYEYEITYRRAVVPALKALDRHERVIHVGAFSKSIAPDLRIGYIVAPAQLIARLRELRRLILRHPPGNSQRILALFLADGHFERLMGRLNAVYRGRRDALGRALDRHLPDWRHRPNAGGVSFWVAAPEHLDTRDVARVAQRKGVLIDPGELRFLGPIRPRRFARIGYAAIDEARIEDGVRILAALTGKAGLSAHPSRGD